jgi:hypothetical protein
MSTAKFDTWLNSDGTTNYKCRAWVNFDGTGTVAIRASGNVSSITDNGTGDYTVNFTTALPDANYAALFNARNFNNIAGWNIVSLGAVSTASSYRFAGPRDGNASLSFDADSLSISIFR